MPDILKVRDVSIRYDVSTRALKYYEDMGLITSTHVDDYSYRCYDEKNISRLEQILILRKLDISIKDIVRIFSSAGADILLELLHDKVDSINEQTFLLLDLKNIILDFIDQIEHYDFNSQNDIKLLYEKTASLEKHFKDPSGASVEKLMEVTKKLEKEPVVSVINFPSVKMALCYDQPDSDRFGRFKEWVKQTDRETHPMFSNYFEWFNAFNGHIAGLYPLPYLYGNTHGYENCPFDTFDFPGGLYACATFLDDPYFFSMEINAGFIYKWVGRSEDYELYLTENDADARYIMWRPLPAAGREQPQVEFFIPIVKKGENRPVKILDLDTKKLLDPLKIKRKHEINLRSMQKNGDLSVRFDKDDLVLYQLGQEGRYDTADNYHFPLRIDITAKTDSSNIRVRYGRAGMIFNWGVIPTAMLTSDILEGGHYPVYGAGYVPPNEYIDAIWILEREYAAVIVNGQVRFYKTDFPYIERLKKEPELIIKHSIGLSTAFNGEVTVKNLTVYELN